MFEYCKDNGINSVDAFGLNPSDRFYGLPRDFWNWYHRQIKRDGDPDLERDEAEGWYREWERLDRPGPDGSRCDRRRRRGGRDGDAWYHWITRPVIIIIPIPIIIICPECYDSIDDRDS
jgi:hypothetical protein